MEPQQYYSIFMFVSLGVFLLVRWFIPKPVALQEVPYTRRIGIVLAAFLGGTFGAKLPFALSGDAGWFSQDAWISDGKTVTTALVGAYLGLEIAKVILGVHVKTGDTFALPLALALAVGRWGCFFNGCCYGVVTDLPWGVEFLDPFTNTWARRHPTQIYEVLFHLMMAVLILRLMQLDVLKNQRLKLYLICYGLFRFLTEYIRPEPAQWLGLTFYQWVALVIIVAMVIQWKIDARMSGKKTTQMVDEPLTSSDGQFCPSDRLTGMSVVHRGGEIVRLSKEPSKSKARSASES